MRLGRSGRRHRSAGHAFLPRVSGASGSPFLPFQRGEAGRGGWATPTPDGLRESRDAHEEYAAAVSSNQARLPPSPGAACARRPRSSASRRPPPVRRRKLRPSPRAASCARRWRCDGRARCGPRAGSPHGRVPPHEVARTPPPAWRDQHAPLKHLQGRLALAVPFACSAGRPPPGPVLAEDMAQIAQLRAALPCGRAAPRRLW